MNFGVHNLSPFTNSWNFCSKVLYSMPDLHLVFKRTFGCFSSGRELAVASDGDN